MHADTRGNSAKGTLAFFSEKMTNIEMLYSKVFYFYEKNRKEAPGWLVHVWV